MKIQLALIFALLIYGAANAQTTTELSASDKVEIDKAVQNAWVVTFSKNYIDCSRQTLPLVIDDYSTAATISQILHLKCLSHFQMLTTKMSSSEVSNMESVLRPQLMDMVFSFREAKAVEKQKKSLEPNSPSPRPVRPTT